MKKILFALSAVLLMSSCIKDRTYEPEGGGKKPINDGPYTTITYKSSLSVNLTTDKAYYKPGETVTFTADNLPSETTFVRYRNGSTVIAEQELSSKTWTWTAPSTDYTGYMIDLYQKVGDTGETIKGSIAVDVSSDWNKFPRYGFVAAFGSDKTASVTAQEMEFLNRYHINGVQFQDWHYKHHWPLGGTRDELYERYTDIANRYNYTASIKNYISAQHKYGMKAIFYNLAFGALNDAADDGVKESWYLFKDSSHKNKDSHNLPDSWKSDIFLTNPGNTEWQNYMVQRNDDVYHNLDFDGYQIDQLGNRGIRYDYNGSIVNMPQGYASFINAMKKAHPTKALVMNAVSNYGAQQICQTGNVDFCYNELWAGESEFNSLYDAIKSNYTYSNNKLNTVFAAYMNYDLADNTGYFNNAGVLLTDAVMFALGGSHLELGGDHMLCKEYFPNTNLKMKSSLKSALVRYYDFMTAYENLLRDGGSEYSPIITSETHDIAAWAPQAGKIITYSKQVGNKQIIHLLNFKDANSMSWRDLRGTMPEPTEQVGVSLTVKCDTEVKHVYAASPDYMGGIMQELIFTQKDGVVSFSAPALKYWTMIVME